MEAFILNPGSGPLSRNIEDYPEGIIIPIDKPYRWTSADVIRKVKFAAIRHFGKKNLKVGHAGTLDPLATGILLVCIGKATKLAETLQSHDKEYVAGITFGATTPSYDLEKEIDRFFPYEHITEDSVREALPAFVGEQDQIAPLFSAKSVDGVRAYELARRLHKEGKTLDDAAEELIRISRITISALELLRFECRNEGLEDRATRSTEAGGSQAESGGVSEAVHSASCRINVTDNSALGLPRASVRMVCSKGTYVRAFARDLGEALGTGAHLDSLQRSRSGIFRIENALTVDRTISLLSHP
ncbi:MAG: tRNA pseudouridine(55) synthase TruB [Bacteroidales bacterium]|nr:tRNA pseudouridine(55) synthase TruB [Bacteroidales bacterium]